MSPNPAPSEENLKTKLNELIQNRGLNNPKLSELTGVPERFIEALRAGNAEALPSAPYVRGYLIKIGYALGANGEDWWKEYQSETEFLSSGTHDRLPENRFAVGATKTKARVALAIVVMGLGIYGTFRFNIIIGKPELRIENPAAATLIVNSEHFMVRGTISEGDKLQINGEGQLSEDGKFEKEVALEPGVNIIEFKASRFLGREVSEIKKIIYQP